LFADEYFDPTASEIAVNGYLPIFLVLSFAMLCLLGFLCIELDVMLFNYHFTLM